MKEVVEGRKLETENAHHWRQTKHLLRYVKAQEREIGKTERFVSPYIYTVHVQHIPARLHMGCLDTEHNIVVYRLR